MTATCAHESRGIVEDRGEVWVVGWLAGFVCAVGCLGEETGRGGSRCSWLAANL